MLQQIDCESSALPGLQLWLARQTMGSLRPAVAANSETMIASSALSFVMHPPRLCRTLIPLGASVNRIWILQEARVRAWPAASPSPRNGPKAFVWSVKRVRQMDDSFIRLLFDLSLLPAGKIRVEIGYKLEKALVRHSHPYQGRWRNGTKP
jgi:hypothetical protein